jgi:hypothetical protein
MNTSHSVHATIRLQQRGIPPLVSQWLLDYGAEQFDGHGGVIRYFSPDCVRRLEKEVGRTPVKRLHEYLRCYLVQSSLDGMVITVGKRHPKKRIWKH